MIFQFNTMAFRILRKFSADDILKHFSYFFFQKTAQQAHVVYTTSPQRDAALTLRRCCINVMCPLGGYSEETLCMNYQTIFAGKLRKISLIISLRILPFEC